MKRSIFKCLVLVAVSSMMVSLAGCHNDEMVKLHERVDDLSKMSIIPLENQVGLIKTSIGALEQARTQIEGDIHDLQKVTEGFRESITGIENQIADLSQTTGDHARTLADIKSAGEKLKTRLDLAEQAISGLKKKHVELGDRIDSLKRYVDEQVTDTRDWATRTFANLEEYKKTAELIGSLKGEYETINKAFGEFKDNIYTKIETDIAAAVEKLTADIEKAVSKAKSEIEVTLGNRVDSLGKDLHNWVVAEFDDYYTIAETDALLSNFKTELEMTIHKEDAVILSRLTSLQNDLNQAKSDIKTAYEKAISDAIAKASDRLDNLDVKIEDIKLEMGEEFQNVRGAISEIDTLVKGLAEALTNLGGRVSTLEQQRVAIESDIVALQAMDKTINDRIDSLGQLSDDTIKELKKADIDLAAVDEQLKKADTIIRGQILDLRTYVDGDLRTAISQEISTSEQGVRTWASQTFATLVKHTELTESLATVSGIVDGLVSDLSDLQTIVVGHGTRLDDLGVNVETLTGNLATLSGNLTALDSTMNAKFSEMETWVGEQFESKLANYYTAKEMNEMLGGYYTKTDFDEILDAQHQTIVGEIEAAKTELKAAYEVAIEKAITEMAGIITQELSDAIVAAEGRFNERISALDSRVAALECRIQSVVFIPEFTDGRATFYYRYNSETDKDERTTDKITLRFKVNTYNGEFDKSKFDIKADLIDPSKRNSPRELIPLESAYKDGILTCLMDNSHIGDDIIEGELGYAVSVVITAKSGSGTMTNYSTEYVGIMAQAAPGSDPETFRLNRSNLNFTYGGGSDEVTLTAIGTWRYTISNNSSWMSINVLGTSVIEELTNTYTGSGRFIITAAPNTTTTDRTATVTITRVTDNRRLTITVKQTAHPEQILTLDPEPKDFTFTWSDTKTEAISVTPSDGLGDWTAEVDGVGFEAFKSVGEMGKGIVTVRATGKGTHSATLIVRSAIGEEFRYGLTQEARPLEPSIKEETIWEYSTSLLSLNLRQEITFTKNAGTRLKVSGGTKIVVQYVSGTDRRGVPEYSNVPQEGISFNEDERSVYFALKSEGEATINETLTFTLVDGTGNVVDTLKYTLTGTITGRGTFLDPYTGDITITPVEE